jgi:hypothetical protein
MEGQAKSCTKIGRVASMRSSDSAVISLVRSEARFGSLWFLRVSVSFLGFYLDYCEE